MTSRSFYDILGVNKNASLSEIKKAYAKLAQIKHPDKIQGDEKVKKAASAEFSKINIAYQTLSNAEKRKIYDEHGEDGLQYADQFSDSNEGFPANHPFASMFGGNPFGSFSSFSSFSENNETNLNPVGIEYIISLEDIFLGRLVEEEIIRENPCNACSNTGFADKKNHKCNNCNGSGLVIKKIRHGNAIIEQRGHCNSCSGTGKCNKTAKCSSCKGNGNVKEKHILKFDIPKGTKNGERIVKKSEGDYIKGKRRDIIIIFVEKPHEIFSRSGDNDLIMNMEITLSESLYKFTKTFEHLDKRKLTITSNEVVKEGDIITISNEGIEGKKGTGDLHIKIKVKNDAENLSEEIREQIYKLIIGSDPNPSNYIVPEDSCLVHTKKNNTFVDEKPQKNNSNRFYSDENDDDDSDDYGNGKRRTAQCAQQ